MKGDCEGGARPAQGAGAWQHEGERENHTPRKKIYKIILPFEYNKKRGKKVL